MLFQEIVHNIIYISIMLIIARVLSSFIVSSRPDADGNPIIRTLYSITDPMLAPFEFFTASFSRRTGWDLAPLMAIIVFNMLDSFVQTLGK